MLKILWFVFPYSSFMNMAITGDIMLCTFSFKDVCMLISIFALTTWNGIGMVVSKDCHFACSSSTKCGRTHLPIATYLLIVWYKSQLK